MNASAGATANRFNSARRRLPSERGAARAAPSRHVAAPRLRPDRGPACREAAVAVDGSRDRDDLEAAIREYVARGGLDGADVEPPGDLAVALDAALARLAELSLLVA